MSTKDTDEGQVLSPENWGRFDHYRAIEVACRLLSGTAQHVAMRLAHETYKRRCRNGVIEITHREIAMLTGRGKDQIPVAIAECVEAGLLHQRRIMGGFKYTWGRVAYFPTEAVNVVDAVKKTSSDPASDLRDAARQCFRREYLLGLHDKYKIQSDSPAVPALLNLTQAQEAEIVANLAYGAEKLGMPVEEFAKKAFGKFFANDGKDGKFLKNAKHPLARFSEDVALIVCNLISFADHLRRQGVVVDVRPSERVEHHVSLRPEVRALNAQASRDLLAAMGIRRPAERQDLKLAANG
ncbi:MAG: hypothetical protein E6Q97_03270 [Desulfurellales bacterium]|nr:MAG: hypothetical protein E6Q97_03270 [Desulfurellales bacterium]